MFNSRSNNNNNNSNMITDEMIIEGIGLDIQVWNTLKHWQKDNIRFFINHDGKGISGLDQGFGKTLVALLIALFYLDDWPLLAITTNSNLAGLYNEVKKWVPIAEDSIRLAIDTKKIRYEKYTCTGDCKKRLKAQMKKNGDTKIDVHFDWCNECKKDQYQRKYPPHKTYLPLDRMINIISHDQAKIRIEEITARKFAIVIFDESKKIKALDSQFTQLLLPILVAAKRRILLSGTPGNRPIELWNQIYAVQPTLFKSQDDYINRYCNPVLIPNNGRPYYKYTGATNTYELHDILKKNILFRWTKDDEEEKCSREGTRPTIPPKKRKLFNILLPDEQEETCKRQLQEWKDKVKETTQNGNNNNNHNSSFQLTDKVIKLVESCFDDKVPANKKDQTTNVMYTKMCTHLSLVKRKLIKSRIADIITNSNNYYKRHPYLIEEIEHGIPTMPTVIADLIAEYDSRSYRKMIFWAHTRLTMECIVNCLKEQHVTYIYIDGTVHTKERADLIYKFQQEDSPYRVAVFSLKACCEAITLTKASESYFCELIPDPTIMLQAEDRIHRLSQEAPEVMIEYWIVKNSVDELNWDIFCNKVRISGSVLDKKKVDYKNWIAVHTEERPDAAMTTTTKKRKKKDDDPDQDQNVKKNKRTQNNTLESYLLLNNSNNTSNHNHTNLNIQRVSLFDN